MQAIYETGKQLIRLINSHNDIIVSSHCVVSAVKIQAIIFMLFHYVLSASLTLSLSLSTLNVAGMLRTNMSNLGEGTAAAWNSFGRLCILGCHVFAQDEVNDGTYVICFCSICAAYCASFI